MKHLKPMHVADRFAEAFERAFHHTDAEPVNLLPRAVPPAPDWDDWHWDHGRLKPEEVGE